MRIIHPDDREETGRLFARALETGGLLNVINRWLGCSDKCPYVPGLRRDDWPLPDPKGRPMDEVRAVRDDIKVRVAKLIIAEGLDKAA